jgi:hypothetical protein
MTGGLMVTKAQGQAMVTEIQAANDARKAQRLVATLPPAVMAELDELAESARFSGNKSKAVAWCVQLGAMVLRDDCVSGLLFDSPADAMSAFIKNSNE